MSEIDTSTTAGKIQVMSAFERGEKIEFRERTLDSTWELGQNQIFEWNWSKYDYRIADPYAELKAAHAAGKVIQYNAKTNNQSSEGGWLGGGHLYLNPTYSEKLNFRIKPEPKRVPLEASDIPAVCWIRSNTVKREFLVSEIDSNGVWTSNGCGNQMWSWTRLYSLDVEYSEDRRNWKPCYKEI